MKQMIEMQYLHIKYVNKQNKKFKKCSFIKINVESLSSSLYNDMNQASL